MDLEGMMMIHLGGLYIIGECNFTKQEDKSE